MATLSPCSISSASNTRSALPESMRPRRPRHSVRHRKTNCLTSCSIVTSHSTAGRPTSTGARFALWLLTAKTQIAPRWLPAWLGGTGSTRRSRRRPKGPNKRPQRRRGLRESVCGRMLVWWRRGTLGGRANSDHSGSATATS